MRKLLHLFFFLSFIILSCSHFTSNELPKESTETIPCPLDSCQKATIELSMQGLNYSAPFTCYKWMDWGTGLQVDWTDGGRILFFTFPNHRICNAEFRICAEDVCDCFWQPIESCPRNNALTGALDTCLFGQSTLYLDVYLQDN